MKYLIINADDYGLCKASNEAVDQLFKEGAITTATLMVPCPYAEDAVRRAKENPKMCIGLHITTTAEYDTYRWGPIDQSCKSLTDSDGYFYRTAADNLAHAEKEEMLREIKAQFQWMEKRGLPPEHVDSHMATVYGLHGFSCMSEVIQLCAKKKLHFRFPHMCNFPKEAPESLKKRVEKDIQNADALRVGLPNALFTNDYDIKPEETYESFRDNYIKMLDDLPEGVSELFMHPCIETDQLKSINSQWKKRVWEYQTLLDPVFQSAIKHRDIRLTSYHEAPFFTKTDKKE